MSAPQPRTRGIVWDWLTVRGRIGWVPRIAMVAALAAAFYAAPMALLVGALVLVMERRRPDRLVWWLVAALAAAFFALVWATGADYWQAWASVREALDGSGDWSPGDVVEVVVWSLVAGVGFGAVWSLMDQRHRERQPMGGQAAREERERCEGERVRRQTHTVQATVYTGHPPASVALRRLAVPLGTKEGPILGQREAGDLRWPGVPGRRRLIVLPRSVPHVVLLGATRKGKTEIAHRLMEHRIATGEKVIFINAKEPVRGHEVALRLAAAADRHGRTFRSLIKNASPWDPMRGDVDEIRNRLLGTQVWRDEFWEHASSLLIGLALDLSAAEGRPLVTLPDVVFSLPRERLEQLAGSSAEARELLGMMSNQATSGAVLRWSANALALRGWIGPAEVGGWSWSDADVIAMELPTSTENTAARMVVRAAFGDLEQWVSNPERRDMSVPVLLVVDELGALDTDPVMSRRVTNLVERAASAKVNVVLIAQTPDGLGDERAVATCLTNCAVITAAQADSPAVERIAHLAGTRVAEEASAAYSGTVGIAPGSGSIRAQHQRRVDPNDIRQLAKGEVIAISEGRWARIAVAMPESGYREPSGPAVDALRSLQEEARRREILTPDSPAALTDGALSESGGSDHVA